VSFRNHATTGGLNRAFYDDEIAERNERLAYHDPFHIGSEVAVFVGRGIDRGRVEGVAVSSFMLGL